TFSTSANLNAGSYTQTASPISGADANDYTFAGYTSGSNYVVNKLALTGAAIAGVTTTYGTPAAAGAVSFGNVVSGAAVGREGSAPARGLARGSLNNQTFSTSGNLNAGSYTQTASPISGADANDYTFAGYTSGSNYVVNKLALTGAAIAGVTTTYGTPAAAGAVSFGNVVSGGSGTDQVVSTASLNNQTFSTSGNLNAGSYTQTASPISGADANDYTFDGYTSG